MREKINFIRLAYALLFLFFIGKLIVGSLGGSYELGIRLFALVPMTVHLCLIWGAMSNSFKGEKIGYAATCGLLIALFTQILIFVGTLGSMALGVETHFNNPIAIIGNESELTMAGAFSARLTGLLVNSIIGAIAASIGWLFGKLVPLK